MNKNPEIMKNLVAALLLLLTVLFIQSCREDETGPVVYAEITADSTAVPGDTVWLYADRSTGYDSVAWSINIQPGHDTIQDAWSDTAWLVPRTNGLYNIKLTAIKGDYRAIALHDLQVSGPNVIYGWITSDTTLAKAALGEDADYLVTGILVVDARLDFDLQVVMEFEPEAGIIVTANGSIDARNVTFRAQEDRWIGIQLLGQGNFFVSSTIDGGGTESFTLHTDQKANLILSGEATASLSGNTFSNSHGYGLVVESGARLVYNDNTLTHAFANNSFVTNASGPMLIPASALELLSGPDLSHESENTSITIYESEYGSLLSAGATISDYGLPYHITGLVTFRKNLSVLKGAELIFDEDAGLNLYSPLNITGTASEPVVCDGTAGTSGSWKGIHVRSSDAVITYAVIRNGGGSTLPDLAENASLIVGGLLNMQHSEITGSAGIGLWMRNNGVIQYASNFTGNTFSDNQTTNIRLGFDDVHKVISGNTLTPYSAETPVIEVRKGKSDFLDNWQDIGSGIDYRVVDSVSIVSTKSLTIDPGVTIQFAEGAVFNISGSLAAAGTASNPIAFTGAGNTAGLWRGIFIRTDNSVVMDYVTISGGGGDATDKANVIIRKGAAKVTITNSTITNSAGYGVLVKSGASGFAINAPESNNTLSGTLGGYHEEN